jgi:transposase InsO family protein
MLKHKFNCGRNRIARLKAAANIYSFRRKAYKFTTNSQHKNSVSSNLLGRHFKATSPNLAWVSDISYVPTSEGWLYLVIIKDLFTKKVVGYSTSSTINTALVLNALNMAIRRQNPSKGLIFHSDRGVQYTSNIFRMELNKLGFLQSMSPKGNPYDNAVAENFFSCIKSENLHLQSFSTRIQAELNIFHYIECFYNRIRPHSSLNWIPPNSFENLFYSSLLSA